MEYMKKQGIEFEKQFQDFLKDKIRVRLKKGSYTKISEAISTLTDAEYELRRRFLVPYEETKILDNGDVE